MNNRKLFAFSIALVGMVSSPFAFANKDKDTHVMKDSAMNLDAIQKTNIRFDMASWTLSESNKSALRKLVQEAQAKGTVKQITVAAWSDKALPKQGQKLGDKDRELSDKRASAVKDYLKTQMDGIDVDAYNMAESSNWLARLFNTRDAELKSVFTRSGAEKPVTHEEFIVIKKEGGPSKAALVVEFKDTAKSDTTNGADSRSDSY